MRTLRLLCAALLPLLPWSNAPAEPKPLPWLVAQSMLGCELENRRVPPGTQICTDRNVWECGPGGNWVNTGKEC